MPQQDRNISASFAKGLEILNAFDGGTRSLTLAEMAQRTGQDRATARRGALTLVAAGYLRKAGRDYALAPRILGLAGAFLQSHRFGRLVQPVLNHHAAELGSEITLALRDQDKVLMLAQSTIQDGPVSHGFTTGSYLPLLHTSLGRMLLACEAEEIVARWIRDAPMPRHTQQSLTEPSAIAARICRAAADGYCITDAEFEAGIRGMAVPVPRPNSVPRMARADTWGR